MADEQPDYWPSTPMICYEERIMKFIKCPACGSPMILIMKDSTGGWKSYWRCLENRSAGCQDLLDDI